MNQQKTVILRLNDQIEPLPNNIEVRIHKEIKNLGLYLARDLIGIAGRNYLPILLKVKEVLLRWQEIPMSLVQK